MARFGKPFESAELLHPDAKVGIIYSTYYEEENLVMVNAARDTLVEQGIAVENVSLHPVLGSFEVPLIGAALAEAGAVDALIGFGIVLQGETTHAQYIVGECARAMMDIQMQYRLPFAFEILHVDSLEQVHARSSGPGNKGQEAAQAVLHSLAELRRLQS